MDEPGRWSCRFPLPLLLLLCGKMSRWESLCQSQIKVLNCWISPSSFCRSKTTWRRWENLRDWTLRNYFWPSSQIRIQFVRGGREGGAQGPSYHAISQRLLLSNMPGITAAEMGYRGMCGAVRSFVRCVWQRTQSMRNERRNERRGQIFRACYTILTIVIKSFPIRDRVNNLRSWSGGGKGAS